MRKSILEIQENKTQQEREVIRLMVELYCKRHKHAKKTLCPECQALADYADDRIKRCPKRETKTFCRSCSTHCYKSQMREQVKMVMRFSGPRMLFYHPLLAIRHLLDTRRQKSKEKSG